MIALPRLALIAAACSSVAAFAVPTTTDLGHLGGGYSNARAVTAYGSVVVGESYDVLMNTRAFRWTQAGGMTDIGTLGGAYSVATGVCQDGSLIVGNSSDGTNFLAFRWTQAGGMTSLGTLGGPDSYAAGVSAAGNVITGKSNNGSHYRAFRWTQADGMTDLGHLGSNSSEAFGISANGLVIVGESFTGSRMAAFRWTQADGMTDIGTLGGDASAMAASADGSVIVGGSDSGSGTRAFRWTQAGGMVNLGVLGGSYSLATAVSGDGSVVAGQSSFGGNLRAFRWTQADGMTDIGTLGGAYSAARGISADGSVIVGESETATGDYHAFLYRANVMLDATDWLGSVAGVQSMLSNTLGLTRMFLEGAHHRPLGELGRGRSYWVTGDVAGSSRSRDVLTRSGEAGVTFTPWQNVLVGLGAGYGLQDQQLANDGDARTFGQYLVGEIDFLQADGGIFSILLSSGDWENDTRRGYVTGGGVDYSQGRNDVKSSSFRLRYDSPVLLRAFATDFKAYASYGHSRVRSDGYLETGGSNPAGFDAMEQTAKEGRLGVVATHAFGEKLRARLSAEWIRRFDHDLAALTATDLTGMLALTLPTPDPVRDQARAGLDLDYLLDAQTTLSFTVQAAGFGESADVSGAISLRKAF